jgi:hypothetical protein
MPGEADKTGDKDLDCVSKKKQKQPRSYFNASSLFTNSELGWDGVICN